MNNDTPTHSRPLHRRIAWRWVIVGALATLTLVLGMIGFAEHFHGRDEPRSRWDIFYLTLQLFTLESGAVEGLIGWQLEVARFLAPVVAAYAIVNTTLTLFSVQLQRFGLRLRSGHTIVGGLGRKGIRLVQHLRSRGERVVVIEPDEANTDLRRCHDLGAVVLIGRADHEWELRKAHVSKAKSLISVVGNDGVNVETAVRAHSLVMGHRNDPLRCIIHVADPDLQTLFKQHDIFTAEDDPFVLEFFNVYEVGACGAQNYSTGITGQNLE